MRSETSVIRRDVQQREINVINRMAQYFVVERNREGDVGKMMTRAGRNKWSRKSRKEHVVKGIVIIRYLQEEGQGRR